MPLGENAAIKPHIPAGRFNTNNFALDTQHSVLCSDGLIPQNDIGPCRGADTIIADIQSQTNSVMQASDNLQSRLFAAFPMKQCRHSQSQLHWYGKPGIASRGG